MAFQFDKRNSSAVSDPETGATISEARRFTDSDSDAYVYKDREIRFEFSVWVQSEERSYVNASGTHKRARLPVIAYLSPSEIEREAAQAWKKADLPANPTLDYDSLRERIRSGVFTLLTRGGYQLQFVPDFAVEFAERSRLPLTHCR